MKYVAILSLALLLAACGRGGGDVVVSPPNHGDDPAPTPPDPLEEVNSTTLSDVIFESEDHRARWDTWECREDLSFVCSAEFEGTRVWFDPRGKDLTHEVQGEWAHLFIAGVSYDETALFAGAAGVIHPNSLPAGPATWRGNMVGVYWPTTRPPGEDGQVVRGGAEITLVNVSEPTVDVVLTPDGLPELRWDGLSVEENGRFSAYDAAIEDVLSGAPYYDAEYVLGEFYGPNAEEAGGVFERDSIIGAFGAKLQ